MSILALAVKSLLSRRTTAVLVILSIGLSVALLLGVERLRTQARASFANTISGTDLVVGARTGATALLLHSVFRIGYATNNVSWTSYQEIARHPRVRWTIPLSLGDSHRGFAVLGTSLDYFRHYRYARTHGLELAAGRVFDDVYDAVVGADVARELGYHVGKSIVVAHGAVDAGLSLHDDKPFRVVGVLRKTGTPVDRTVHVTLAGLEAIHLDWQSGMRVPGATVSADEARHHDLTPRSITAFLIGLDSRTAVFHVQRFVNEYRREPLLAILPGVVLQELWDAIGVAEQALLAVSALVALVGLCGMVTALLTGLNERRREMAILRSVGARPRHVLTLIVGEATALATTGIALGVALLYLALVVVRDVIQTRLGLSIEIGLPSRHEWLLLGAVLLASFVAGLWPAMRAYRQSLADGMMVHV
ncbi:MAG TPA: ABC transporter permease [Candidatus Nitrosotalea sp.]|jgi:putative ABC transport system permease protein|nr:ABC transporter permease [Candidatus Nitrosotalea sp.]